jgi:hypothetical protein
MNASLLSQSSFYPSAGLSSSLKMKIKGRLEELSTATRRTAKESFRNL